MKSLNRTILFITALFFVSQCQVTISSGSSTPHSEGSTSNPVQVYLNTTYSGQVDGTNHSYYVYYGTASTCYTILVSNLTGDVDMWSYDGSFFTGSPIKSATIGLSNETHLDCPATGNLMIEIIPYTGGTSATYDLLVY